MTYVDICILHYFLAEEPSHSSKQMVSQQQTETWACHFFVPYPVLWDQQGPIKKFQST